jgi:hypothetical protein
LFRQIFLARHYLVSPLLPAAPDAITHCGGIRSGGTVQK